MNIILSIIVPVFIVEKYIRVCYERIFRQGLKDADWGVIIVNDGTKDRSMEMITDNICKHSNFTVINQVNEGLSVARNNSISKAKDLCIAIACTWNLAHQNRYSSPVSFKLLEDVWTSFSILICFSYHHLRNKEERNMMIGFLKEKVPYLYFRNGVKQKLYSFLFRNIPHSFICLHYNYGMIFENKVYPFYHHQLRRLFSTK